MTSRSLAVSDRRPPCLSRPTALHHGLAVSSARDTRWVGGDCAEDLRRAHVFDGKDFLDLVLQVSLERQQRRLEEQAGGFLASKTVPFLQLQESQAAGGGIVAKQDLTTVANSW